MLVFPEQKGVMTEIYTSEDKEDILRRVLEACDSRSDLHRAYKKKLKAILIDFTLHMAEKLLDIPDGEFDLERFAEGFVESRCRPE